MTLPTRPGKDPIPMPEGGLMSDDQLDVPAPEPAMDGAMTMSATAEVIPGSAEPEKEEDA